MSKGNKGTTNRRSGRPARLPRPPSFPTVTEQFYGKAKIGKESKRRSLIERFKEWGNRLRRLFGRKKKRRIETKTIKSKWRKAARALHQMERRRA